MLVGRALRDRVTSMTGRTHNRSVTRTNDEPNHTDYRNHPTNWGASYVAVQYWLGLLSQWGPGFGASNTRHLVATRPYLAGRLRHSAGQCRWK
jgi:hypothetical protein